MYTGNVTAYTWLTPHVCARGKVIGLYVDYHCRRHENCQFGQSTHLIHEQLLSEWIRPNYVGEKLSSV